MWTDGVGQRNAASLAKGAPHWMNCGKRDAVVYPRQLANERIVHEPLRRRRPEDVGTKKRHVFFFGLPSRSISVVDWQLFLIQKKIAGSGLGAQRGGVELRP